MTRLKIGIKEDKENQIISVLNNSDDEKEYDYVFELEETFLPFIYWDKSYTINNGKKEILHGESLLKLAYDERNRLSDQVSQLMLNFIDMISLTKYDIVQAQTIDDVYIELQAILKVCENWYHNKDLNNTIEDICQQMNFNVNEFYGKIKYLISKIDKAELNTYVYSYIKKYSPGDFVKIYLDHENILPYLLVGEIFISFINEVMFNENQTTNNEIIM